MYHGSASGLATTPAWTAESDQDGACFGVSVARRGTSTATATPTSSSGHTTTTTARSDEGRAFVYHGSASGLSTTAAWTAESDQAGAGFGCSVARRGTSTATATPTSSSGHTDYDNGQTDEGRAFVYHGSASGLSTTRRLDGREQPGRAPTSATRWRTAGDVNGDGYADVIVGAHGYDNGQTDEGRAFVYHGSASGLSTTAAWTAESDQADACFGCSVARRGTSTATATPT